MRRVKGIAIKVHPDFYNKIERERKKFMKKRKLDKLTTVAFTGVLGNKFKNALL